MSYPLDPPRLGWGRNCVSLGTLSTLESPLLRLQRARSSSRCLIAAMVHRRRMGGLYSGNGSGGDGGDKGESGDGGPMVVL